MGITPVAGSVQPPIVNPASDLGAAATQIDQAKFTMSDASRAQSVPEMIRMAETLTTHPSLDFVQGIAGLDPISRLDVAQAAFRDGIEQVSSSAIEHDDARFAESMKLMAMMSDVQSATLNVEFFSKCVEHAVSGTKTILATQT